MSIRLKTAILPIVLALVMAFGWLLPHTPSISSAPSMHSELATSERTKMTGSHFHETIDLERAATHAPHTHNSAEHLHEMPNLAVSTFLACDIAANAWSMLANAARPLNTTSEFLRPPCERLASSEEA